MPGAALDAHEREEIRIGLEAKGPLRAIVRRLDRTPSAVTREEQRSVGRAHYSVVRTEQRCTVCPHQPLGQLGIARSHLTHQPVAPTVPVTPEAQYEFTDHYQNLSRHGVTFVGIAARADEVIEGVGECVPAVLPLLGRPPRWPVRDPLSCRPLRRLRRVTSEWDACREHVGQRAAPRSVPARTSRPGSRGCERRVRQRFLRHGWSRGRARGDRPAGRRCPDRW